MPDAVRTGQGEPPPEPGAGDRSAADPDAITQPWLSPAGTAQNAVWAADPRGPFPQEFGRYVLERRLGGGGMGTVFLAFDRRLERHVALKVPHPHLLADAAALERFTREARAAARLCHPHLCPVLDLGEHAGVHYLTMFYVDGRPLRECRPAAVRDAVALVRTLALALAEAHRLGVVHRDLKPSNIIVNSRGEPVVTDFGLARLVDTAEDLTDLGCVVGTPHYMCPEQYRGDADASGPTCDIYALGVILYELLCGRVPFPTRRGDLIHKILYETPAAPSTIRPELEAALDAICLKALAKRRAGRFADMAEFAAALDGFLNGRSVAVPVGPVANLLDSKAGWQPAPREGARPLVPREAIRFAFTGLGQCAPAPCGPGDRLYLDVGNDLRPGVIDHHHRTAYTGSTAGLMLTHPRLVDEAVLPGRQPGDPFTLVLHEKPDFDAVAAAYLAIEYLAAGTFPHGAEALARYADKVDEGVLGLSLANPYSLYVAYLHLAGRAAMRPSVMPAECWQECARAGVELVGYAVAESVRRGEALPAVDAFACPGLFEPEDRLEVERDVERYRAKLADPHTRARRHRLRLPGQFGGTVEVDALTARDVQNVGDPGRVAFFKDWARTDAGHCPNGRGYQALSVFMSEGPRQVRRCILSVTPDSGATLRGLGALLDRAEAERRRHTYAVDDREQDPASGARREPRPGYANADPWYDGRAHGHTIVDSPRAGTVLTADEIETIFLHFGGVQPG
jgi:predicted Ser/Thr protein kinase